MARSTEFDDLTRAQSRVTPSTAQTAMQSEYNRRASDTTVDRQTTFYQADSGVYPQPDSAKQDMQMLLDELEERDHRRGDRWGEQFVITNNNIGRIIWSIVIVLLLVYTGTVFLYRLAFLEFRIPPTDDADAYDEYANSTAGAGWLVIDWTMTIIFWMDLLVNFFFTYEDEVGHEVMSLRAIVKHYLSSHFLIDLAACLPEDVLTWAIESSIPNNATQGAKALRLQRMTRLARLMRLARLAKITKHMKGPMWNWFAKQRGFHIINLVCGLAWVVHVLACGWYLCAALHDEALYSEVWVARRSVDAAGEISLRLSGPFDQWMQAMYFTLTVFTTVGFGDMSAMTNGEITYVCCMMMVGAVVNGIIVSSVISVVTSSDMVNDYIEKSTSLIDAFSKHTEINPGITHMMKSWVTMSAKYWISHQYDKEEMKDMIVGRMMPPNLLGRLPQALFDGKLLKNSIFHIGTTDVELPPRLPLLLALTVQKSTYEQGDFVYLAEEYAGTLCLVLDGVFAHVAYPGPYGGSKHHDYRYQKDNQPQFPYRLLGHGSYFGDYEVLETTPRQSSVRCESPTGQLLIVHKNDLKDLMSEFPAFAIKWKFAAKRREQARQRQILELKVGMTYEDLAISHLTRFISAKVTGNRESAIHPARAKRHGVHVHNLVAYRQALEPKATLEGVQKRQDRMQHEIEAMAKKMDTMMQVLGQLAEKHGVAVPQPHPHAPPLSAEPQSPTNFPPLLGL